MASEKCTTHIVFTSLETRKIKLKREENRRHEETHILKCQFPYFGIHFSVGNLVVSRALHTIHTAINAGVSVCVSVDSRWRASCSVYGMCVCMRALDKFIYVQICGANKKR